MPTEFRLHAPEAKSVSLVGEMNAWDPRATPMQRGERGTWTVTVPLEKGQWLYKFHVDGRWTQDPENPLSSTDGQGGRHSWVLVGDGDFRRHEGVAHGRIESLRMPFRALGAEVELNPHVPPGSQPGPLPLLVLLHGQGMDRAQWTDNGRVADFMDNLLAAKHLQPFLVAMPSVMPFVEKPELLRFVAEELPAWLAANRRASAERSRRALGGFSMGGGLTLHVAAAFPDSYALWFPLAAAVHDEVMDAWGESMRRAGPIVQACGAEDRLLPTNERIAATLRKLEANAEYQVRPGGHSFRFLNALTPELLERASRSFCARATPGR
ncbi:MAG TPA: alpha/beta hydrolase-fold protein [Myxococcales bacterium]